MATIRVDLTPEQLAAVVEAVGEQVDARHLAAGDALFTAEGALDGALLQYELRSEK